MYYSSFASFQNPRDGHSFKAAGFPFLLVCNSFLFLILSSLADALVGPGAPLSAQSTPRQLVLCTLPNKAVKPEKLLLCILNSTLLE